MEDVINAVLNSFLKIYSFQEKAVFSFLSQLHKFTLACIWSDQKNTCKYNSKVQLVYFIKDSKDSHTELYHTHTHTHTHTHKQANKKTKARKHWKNLASFAKQCLVQLILEHLIRAISKHTFLFAQMAQTQQVHTKVINKYMSIKKKRKKVLVLHYPLRTIWVNLLG